MLNTAQIRRTPKSEFEVNVLMTIVVTAHVCRVETRIPDNALPHGDVHGVIQHRMIRWGEGGVSQSWHVHAGGLQWQLQVSSVSGSCRYRASCSGSRSS